MVKFNSGLGNSIQRGRRERKSSGKTGRDDASMTPLLEALLRSRLLQARFRWRKIPVKTMSTIHSVLERNKHSSLLNRADVSTVRGFLTFMVSQEVRERLDTSDVTVTLRKVGDDVQCVDASISGAPAIVTVDGCWTETQSVGSDVMQLD